MTEFWRLKRKINSSRVSRRDTITFYTLWKRRLGFSKKKGKNKTGYMTITHTREEIVSAVRYDTQFYYRRCTLLRYIIQIIQIHVDRNCYEIWKEFHIKIYRSHCHLLYTRLKGSSILYKLWTRVRVCSETICRDIGKEMGQVCKIRRDQNTRSC